MQIEAQDALRAWLAKELAPVCDAEPIALAKYVQALLRKDKPENELIEFCIEQLDVFLQTKARPFVLKLFNVIKERSYIPQPVVTSTTPPAAEFTAELPHRSVPVPPVVEKKKDIDERKELKDREEERRKMLPEREKEQRKVREEKEIEKKLPQEPPVGAAMQPPRPLRKRISPPPATRDELRRDGPNRFERRRSRSPRERRVERGDRVVDRRNPVPPVARGPHRQNERYKSERTERTERKRSRSPYDRLRRDKSSEGERKRKRCRDYDEKGYCMKGDQCMYDHGPDPVVVDDIALEKMVSSGAKPSAVVPQIAPNFSVPPPGYTPLNPPPPGVDNIYVANSAAVPTVVIASEGYNPEAPAMSVPAVIPQTASTVPMASVDFSVPPPTIQYSNPSWAPPVYPPSTASASVLIHPPSMSYDPLQPSTTVSVPPVPQPQQQQHTHVPRGGGPMRRGRGGVGGYGASSVSGGSSASTNRTLQVRKIPPEMNNITKLNEHFAQFGQIVNIQVCYDGDLEAALITYATRLEAMAAYKSTVPILNNRFVKVFWHNPTGQTTPPTTKNSQPASGSSVTYNAKGSLTKTVVIGNSRPGSAPSSAQVEGGENSRGPVPPSGRPTPSESEKYIEMRRKRKQEKENRMRLLDLHRRKTSLLSKQIEQQKLVVESIQKTTDSVKKKELFKIFKTVDESVEKLKKEMEDLAKMLMNLAQESEEAKKTANGQGVAEANGGESVAGFKRGISDGTNLEVTAPVKKPRHVDSAQSLDMRTRVVVVRDFPADYENEVVTHMENFGDLEDVEMCDRNHGDDGLTAYFTYKNRRDAEQAIELGGDFAFCQLTVEWGPKGGHGKDGVVPDEKRNPAERVTPAALLASCPLDESDDDGAGD